MNNFTKKVLFLLCCMVCSISVWSQQSVRFTWETNDGYWKFLRIKASAAENNNITIDWGPGGMAKCRGKDNEYIDLSRYYYNSGVDFCEVTITVTEGNLTDFWVVNSDVTMLDVSNAPALTDLCCSNNHLTDLDISANTALLTLDCSNNSLTSLDLSMNTALTNLECYNNQLKTLDLSINADLASLSCYNNHIPFIDLYAASKQINNADNIRLGMQTMDELASGGTTLIDSVFYGIGTSFTITIDGNPTIEGVDYSINEGYITFLKWDTYTVEISNPAIISNEEYPAKVFSVFRHCVGLEEENEIQLLVYPNPVNDVFQVKTLQTIKRIQMYDLSGRLLYEKTVENKEVSIDVSNYPSGIYLLDIDGNRLKVMKK